jgi:hypothetical protein
MAQFQITRQDDGKLLVYRAEIVNDFPVRLNSIVTTIAELEARIASIQEMKAALEAWVALNPSPVPPQ